MTGLAIFGAGGLGREVLGYAEDSGMSVVGFVDDTMPSGEHPDLGAPVLGALSDFEDPSHYHWLVALGDARHRRRIYGWLNEHGATFATLIHPASYVSKSATLAPGSIIAPFALVAAHASVASNVVLNTYASVGHDAEVGSHCVFSPYSTVNGQTHIGEEVFLGTGAVVTPRLSIGPRCKVSAGAVVFKSLDPGSLAIGNPARGRVIFSGDDGE